MAGLTRPRLLQVRSRSGTFRRAGQAFGPEFAIVETEALTPEEYRAIVNERELEVTGSDNGEEFMPIAPIDPEPEGHRLEDTDPGSSAGGAPDTELEDANAALEEALSEVGRLKGRLEEAEKALGERGEMIVELRKELEQASAKPAVEGEATADTKPEGELAPPAETNPEQPVAKASSKTKAAAKS